MQSVGVDELQGVSALLAEVESLRAQVERMTQELHKCRECASHFKWSSSDSAETAAALCPAQCITIEG